MIVWVCWALRNNTWIQLQLSQSNSAGALDLLKAVLEAIAKAASTAAIANRTWAL
jgi:hypothetical protein